MSSAGTHTQPHPGSREAYRAAPLDWAKTAATNFRNAFSLNDAVARVARALWPAKTDIELAIRTGLSDRACRNWLADRCGISGDALAALLRSDDGFAFLEEIMGDARPEWWGRFKRAELRAVLRAEIAAHARGIKQFELKL